MKGKKAATIVFLLVWLALSSPLPTTGGRSGIIVEGADSVLDTPVTYSSDLVDTTLSIGPRVAAEYANSTASHALVEMPTALQNLVSMVSKRVAAEYANSTAPHALIELPTALQNLVGIVSKRVIAEYTNSTRVAGMAYPLELMNDLTPPQISDISAGTTSPDTGVITWTTDEFATSTVLYGTQPGVYPYTVSDSLYKKQHEITLTRLTPGIIYYYRVRSTDRSGNTTTSPEYSFTAHFYIYLPLIMRNY